MSDVYTTEDFSWSNEVAQLEMNRDEVLAWRDQGEPWIATPQAVCQSNRSDDDVAPRVGRVGNPRMGRTINDFLKGPPARRR